MNKTALGLGAAGLAVALWRWLAPRSNTQVHRINQP
jgi:biopolymer transport protein ExbB/TolQ